ncbi:MAG: UDP-N-acetylglucosamine 2-epimerase (non-hydrolyzing) [Gammaproteobacteria bacterium]|nr:UDP-N-acetylglucosamine 2-epimerase (non-hydrolyzing) [Gammaproteobacteria bacterium]
MPKIMTIVGTRPEIIKMSRVIAEFDAYTDHLLVHTGQNYDYELNEVFFEDLSIRKPDYFLEAVGDSASATIGRIIEESDKIMRKERPDAVLLYGDTNSCLSVISAKRNKIPVFHFEAGNRCFDQRVPEELNRKVLDHLSDINFVLTEHARRYLLAEGIPGETIIKTGSHMNEVLDFYMQDIENSDALTKLEVKPREYFIVSAHREENVDSPENLKDMLSTLNKVAEEYELPIIVTTHPRTKDRLDKLGESNINPLVKFLKPFGFCDYIKLQQDALCVISDSGTITEESSILNLPAITIRNAHERPEGMDTGTLIMSGLKSERVLDSIDIIIRQNEAKERVIPPIPDYEVNHVSKQVLRVVISYIDYINRTVWSVN